jgi:hypothetical protein
MPSRVLGVLSLAGIGGWGVLSVLLGTCDAVTELHARWTETHPVLLRHGVPEHVWLIAGLEMALFFVWVLSLNGVLVAVVLGIVDVALTYRSWWRAIAFAIVGIGGPSAALWENSAAGARALTGDDVDTIGLAVGLMVIAALTVLAVWVLLDVRRPARATAPVPATPMA